MNILVALPLLPLLAVMWFGLIRPDDRQAGYWVVALAAFFTIAVALLATSQSLEITHLLIRGRSKLVLDGAARPALMLFGALWLAAALLARKRPDGPAPLALLLGLSAAVTLAIARGGPLIFAAMLATGFGLYAIVASEAHGRWRGRLLVILLVASDLLIFEVLLHGTAHAGAAMTGGPVLLISLALLLRGGVPPAHAWLPKALYGASAATAVLLAGMPAGAAFVGGRQLLQSGDAEFGSGISAGILALGLAAALWSTFAAVRVKGVRRALAYAAAMTGTLLLLTTPAIADTTVSVWAVVALSACCAAATVIGLQHAGWARNVAVVLVLGVHGLAAAHAAVLATSGLQPVTGFLAAVVAGVSTMLLAMTLRRTGEQRRSPDSVEAGAVVMTLGGLAATGLWFLWGAGHTGFDSFWPAPAGITLGLLLSRAQMHSSASARLWQRTTRLAAVITGAIPALREFCLTRLPHERDRWQATLIDLWRGEAWAARIARLELMLRAWPATAVLMLLVAIAAAVLLAT